MSDARYLPYLLLLPATLFLSAFFLVPFLGVAVEAFTSSDGALSFDNFRTMAQDWRFWPAFSNTLGLALVIVPIQVVLALAMANLVTSMGSGREIVLYILTVPLGISDLAAGLVWLAILEQNGFLTSFLHGLGLIAGPQPILTYQNLTGLFIAVVVAEVWRATAIVLVILVAGMGLIPREYYEAAEVFGAGAWRRFCAHHLAVAAAEPADGAHPADDPRFRESSASSRPLPAPISPNLMGETYKWQFDFQDRKVASRLRHGDPRDLHRVHAALPLCPSREDGEAGMTASVADARPADDQASLRGGRLLVGDVGRRALPLGSRTDLPAPRQHAEHAAGRRRAGRNRSSRASISAACASLPTYEGIPPPR